MVNARGGGGKESGKALPFLRLERFHITHWCKEIFPSHHAHYIPRKWQCMEDMIIFGFWKGLSPCGCSRKDGLPRRGKSGRRGNG